MACGASAVIMCLKGSVAEHSAGLKASARERSAGSSFNGSRCNVEPCSHTGQTNLTVGPLSARRDQTSVVDHMLEVLLQHACNLLHSITAWLMAAHFKRLASPSQPPPGFYGSSSQAAFKAATAVHSSMASCSDTHTAVSRFEGTTSPEAFPFLRLGTPCLHLFFPPGILAPSPVSKRRDSATIKCSAKLQGCSALVSRKQIFLFLSSCVSPVREGR